MLRIRDALERLGRNNKQLIIYCKGGKMFDALIELGPAGWYAIGAIMVVGSAFYWWMRR